MAKTMKKVGTKLEVFHGKADHTRSGLKKKDFMKNKRGLVVSRKKHALGLKQIKTLYKMGYKPTKKVFRLFKKSDGKKMTKKKLRGGNYFTAESGSSSGSQ